MRTTLRLDDDVVAATRVVQASEHVGFGQALNILARRGMQRESATARYVRPLPARRLGGARFDLTRTEELLGVVEGDARA